MNFSSVFVYMMAYLGYIFVQDDSIFTTIDDEKEVKINSSRILKDFNQSRRKFWKFINTVDSQ